jgi:hypothetical protein
MKLTIPKKNKKRNLLIDAGVVFALVILLVVVNHGLLRRHSTVKAANAVPAPAAFAAPAAAMPAPSPNGALAIKVSSSGSARMIPASFRPLNLALLRGGFTSVDEFFERVNGDPILHSFYGDCTDRHASIHTLTQDALVFTAFRRENQIKWAKRPLLVHKGEYVLTFCGKTVLARCGNLVSMAAMQPSEDIPPDLLETPVDPIEPPITYAAEAASATITPVAAVVPAVAHSHFWFIPPFYVPQGGSHTPPPSITPPPAVHVSGDEFNGHQGLFTLLFGLLAIGLVKLVTR